MVIQMHPISSSLHQRVTISLLMMKENKSLDQENKKKDK